MEDDTVARSEDSFFSEFDEVCKILTNLCNGEWLLTWQSKRERLVQIFSKYQEQPTILSPYLEPIVNPIINFFLFVLKSFSNTEKLSPELESVNREI